MLSIIWKCHEKTREQKESTKKSKAQEEAMLGDDLELDDEL